MKALILYVFLFLIGCISFAQSNQIKFHLVKGSNGYSLGKINAITRDIHGVMWFSDQTNRCITRFDGTKMTSFANDPQNPNSLGGTYPESIFADSMGFIWIGFYGTGVDRFDPKTNTFTHFRHNKNDTGSLSNDFVSVVLIDHFGNLCVGSNGGLDILNQKTGKFKHYETQANNPKSLSHNIVRSIYEDRQGALWVGTGIVWDGNNKGGLNRFDRKTGTFTRYLNDPKNDNSLIDNRVRAIFEDSRGNFWVGTAGDGLHSLDRQTGLFTRHTYNPAKPNQLSRLAPKSKFDHITFMTEDATGNLWIGTLENGLIQYDTQTGQLKHHYENSIKLGFGDNSGWCAYASKDGLFWVSTQKSNLFKVDLFNNFFPLYQNDSGIFSFYQESPTVLWICTINGLIRQDMSTGKQKRFVNEPSNANSLSSNTVESILKDRQGDFWIGTDSGLNRYNAKTEKFTRFFDDSNGQEFLRSLHIKTLFQDSQENLWIGTQRDGAIRLNTSTAKITQYKHESGDTNSLSYNAVFGIIEDETAGLWIATNSLNGGINRLNPTTKKAKHYLKGVSASVLFKAANGVLWVGAVDGLYYYNRKKDDFISIAKENPAINIAEIKSMINDNQQNLWVSSVPGLYKINKSQNQLVHFGIDNGIVLDQEFFTQAASYKTIDGKLLFGTAVGYYSFDPETIKNNPLKIKIEFTDFGLNGRLIQAGNKSILQKPITETNEIRLKHNENTFSLGFSVIDYGNVGDRKTFYTLENYDTDWRQLSTEDKVHYFNIPPGHYTFRIKATNTNTGIWEEKSILVIVSPPWWKSWWAYVLFSLVFIGSIWAFIYYRTRKHIIEKQILEHRINLRTAEVIHQKEALAIQKENLEKALVELQSTQAQLIQKEKLASLGELTAGIAHEIQNPLNFVNNFSELSVELIEECPQPPKGANEDWIPQEAPLGGWGAFLSDLKQNLQKINHHGKRASNIVKGMLEHSRQSTGERLLTDINQLADEYLRLAYHGLRAKDNTFNATLITDFDSNLPKIEVIPQDIGRVLVNLINNAFQSPPPPNGGVNYCKKVIVRTQFIVPPSGVRGLAVIVSDNGSGMSKEVQAKIFQPFFTTKPPGEGTGLGLSLAYDIITKGHGGTIEVESVVGEGTTFTVKLGISTD